MKKLIPAAIAILLILLIGGVTFGPQLMEKYSYSQEEADLYEYFHITRTEDVALLLEDALLDEKAVLTGGVYYFDLATVQEYFNTRFYADTTEGLLLYTTPTQVIRAEMDSTVYETDGSAEDVGYRISFLKGQGENAVCYVAVDFVKKFTNFSYEVFEAPNRMQIYRAAREDIPVADISAETAVRILGGIKSPILRRIKENEQVTVLEKMETWCKIKTYDGLIGYVENKYLTNERTESREAVTDYEVPVYTSLTRDYKICLGWHAVSGVSGNDTLSGAAASATCMNVIAPTWFSIKDNEGNLESFARSSYVEKAHGMGLEVWGVVDNFNYRLNHDAEVDMLTILSATTTRTALIDNIMNGALDCGMDGINIDFEEIPTNTGEHFIQFLRELSIRCRAEGLVLSVDNYVPYSYNAHYDLKEQGIIADYVIIMGYDEHGAGSQEAGSVASIGYVRYGLEQTTGYVDSGKVINALPFYARLWKTSGTQISSEAYPMTSMENVLATYHMESRWDEETGQNYAEAAGEDTFYQMWMEDAESISVKLNVMSTYNLGGVAAWRLGYEPEAIWELIAAYLAQ